MNSRAVKLTDRFFDIEFDGATLNMTFEDQENESFVYRVVFDWVVNYSFQGAVGMVHAPNEDCEILVVSAAGECPIFCVLVIWSMLSKRSEDDDDFHGTAGRAAEGLRAA